MRLPWWVLALLWTLVGCSGTARVVRIDRGAGSTPTVHVPRPEGVTGPIALDDDAVREAVARWARALPLSSHPQEAARRLFEVAPRSGSYLFDVRSRRMIPLGPGEHLTAEVSQADAELSRAYLRWCERTRRRGDCLGLLKEGPVLTGDARFTLAMALAKGAVGAEARMGVGFAVVGQVETVAMAVDGFTVTLAPGAVAMSSRGASTAGAGLGARAFRAWKSFSGFKKAMGPAGSGKQWHHIVEQTPWNVQKFGPEAIHNTENVIAVDVRIHERMSAYYSSRQRIVGDRVVREWLRERSYEQQREFGLRVLKQFGAIP